MDCNINNVPALKKRTESYVSYVGFDRAQRRALEAETKTSTGQEVLIVHNYGHGGSGVTLFWGCAMDVVKIISRFSAPMRF
ncbi:hypothetical protein COOONC_25829 [Cooperia oncophora]